MSMAALPSEFVDFMEGGATQRHTAECTRGAANFASSDLRMSEPSLTDADFDTFEADVTSIPGPDLAALSGPSCVHITRQPVVSNAEGNALITEATAAMERGLEANFTYAERENLDEVHVAQLPAAQAWLTARLADTFFPLLSERYGLDSSSLRVFDS